MAQGTRRHERHGWRVGLARLLRRCALWLLGAGTLALLAWGIQALTGR
jgi:hypothetical protein